MPTRTVVTIAVADRAAAERTLDALAHLPAGGSHLHASAVVHRAEDGRITVRDHREDGVEVAEPASEPNGLRMLLALVGQFVDAFILGNSIMSTMGAAPEPDRVAVERLARSVPPGRHAVVAELTEQDPAAVDRIAADVGATAERHPAEDYRP